MKKIHYIVILSVVGLMASCSDFLNEQLKVTYTSSNFYTTADNASAAVTGIYNSLYGNLLWAFGDIASDDAVNGSGNDPFGILDINNFTANSANGLILSFWQSTYETIARANNAIYYIAPMNIDATLRDRLVGEAKFLRAYSYFNLVNVYGKVPLKLLPQLTSATINVPLSEVPAIYAQIEKDLKEAAAVLPPSYSSDGGRITKGAAYGMLAKADLYEKKYTECLTNIQALENLNQYKLLTNYANLFKAGAEDSSEVIFGLRFSNSISAVGNILNVDFSPSIEGGYFFDAPTQSYVNTFSDSTILKTVDPRLDASIGRDGKPWFNKRTFSASWSPATGYLVKKYNEDSIFTNPLDKSTYVPKSRSMVPYHYMRYADILLMKAEALNESGGAGAAIELNKVRARVGLAPTTAATQTDLRTAIMNERRKELGFEFHRYFDLMRYGQAVAEAALGSGFSYAKNRYFLIPQLELDTNTAVK